VGLQRTQPQEKSEFQLRPSEVIFTLVGLATVVWNFVRFSEQPEFFSWWVLLLIPLGWLGADFVSGVVHWAGDTWGTEKTPILGWRFVRPFRFHHAYPLDMLKTNFWTTNGDTVLAAMPMLLFPFFMPLDTTWGLALGVTVCIMGIGGMWTSQLHLWSHMKTPPRLVRWAQNCRLILTRPHHQKHHKVPFQANYCITNGWCNPILTAIGFFPVMEFVVSKLTGLKPRPETENDRIAAENEARENAAAAGAA
jgi:plasmanylethanolamine desaturase